MRIRASGHAEASSRGLLLVLVLAAIAIALSCSARAARDPIEAEIERWTAHVRGDTTTGEIATSIRSLSVAGLGAAEAARRQGRRWLALQRLASARTRLAAARYVANRPAAQRGDSAAFEIEVSRMGRSLLRGPGALTAASLANVRPAVVRALSEAALPQIRVYQEASLEYGRNTTPEYGFFYLGLAEAQKDFIAWCRTLAEPASGRPLHPRSLSGELDSLEAEMLAAYRPPASIERHPDFIAASSALKEARELDVAGLEHGALLRYLQAALRLALMFPESPALGAAERTARLHAFAARLSADGADHTIARLFLETAEEDLANPAPDARPDTAEAIVRSVLPRYLAALEPARPAPARPKPEVTVTLVRWPYT